MSDTLFLSRAYDCKHCFMKHIGMEADQLFLGPKEYSEFSALIACDEKLRKQLLKHKGGDCLAGMTIIGLSSDGMRAGISEA